MKKIFLSLLVLFVSIVVHSQNENPFAKFGYNVLTVTSSKGEFSEFHDQTDIVEIGSVLFNRHTKEIVKVLDKDETTIDISSATTAMSIDPLCEKYYWISPYAYCANNPINAIDPDGKKIVFITRSGGKIVHYELNAKGNLTNTRTGETFRGSSANGHLGKIVEGYTNMLNSGDANYVKQVTTLINSENTHHVDATKIRKSSVAAGAKNESTDNSLKKAAKGESVGTYTTYDFSSDELSSGLKKTNKTTVSHEVQHQYDYETGNMKDSFDKNGELIKGGKSPTEQRAIKNEDKAREQEKLPKRTTY